jgi:hypothetical protein
MMSLARRERVIIVARGALESAADAAEPER